jgi:Mg-chelatase subunit ChlD
MPTVLKRASFLLLTPSLLLAGLYGWVVLRSPRPDSGKLVRTADRRVVWSGETVRVTLHVNADQELPPAAADTARKPHVMALVIDHSGSMGLGPDSALEAVKSAAAIFARATAGGEQPVGAVSFDHTAQEVMPLGSDGNACAEAIERIPSGGGTDIAQGLLAGRGMVLDGLRSGKYPRADGLIVLLSDGQSDRAAALAAADQTKNDPAHPIRIITVGLGSQIDEELLRQMASSEADFHFTLDPASLGDIYSTIAADFGTVIGHNGRLEEQFNYGAFTLERPPTGFHLQNDPARGQFNFSFPVLFQQRLHIPYTLRAQKVGLYGLGLRPAELTYTPDPNYPGQVRKVVSPLAPTLLVISPLLLTLLYLPFVGYVVWRIWRLFMTAEAVLKVREVEPEIEMPPPLPLPRPEPVREREPQPTLFLGVGEAGRHVLGHVSRLLSDDRYLGQVADPPFYLLYADTRDDEPPAADVLFPLHKAQLPSTLTGPVRALQRAPELPANLGWLPRRELAQIAGAQLDLSQGSHGRRWLTRLALFEACRSAETPFLREWAHAVEWLKRHPAARIVVVGSLNGGTGGALLSDLAYLLRQALPLNYRAEWPIYALGLADLPSEHAYASLNQQAFLAELDRLTVAAHVPRAAVFNDAPPPDFKYLRGRIEEPIFDHFFLLQTPANLYPEQLEREFFSQVAAVCHTFTEHSLSDSLEAHLGAARTREEQYQNRYLEGTVNSAWEYLLRFPAPEIARRMACRFVREVLGPGGLLGVELSNDGRRLELPPVPANPLEEAVNQWPRLSDTERARAQVYQAYCLAAVTRDPRQAAPALRVASLGAPSSLDDFRNDLRSFATRWFQLLLNGSPRESTEARAEWCRHKLTLLHAALAQLVEFDREALALEQQRAGAEAAATASLLAEVQRFHEEWLAQACSWLQTLTDAGIVPAVAPAEFRGVYRLVIDKHQQTDERLKDENLSAWQSILGPEDVADPSLREEELYRLHVSPFLAKEHGFLLRWRWKFTGESDDRVPSLRLQLVTDESVDYAPGAETAEALLRDLFRVADRLTNDLDRVTILNALRSETGELRLAPLVNMLAGLVAEDRGLRINRQFPGADQIRRQLFVMTPAAPDAELQQFNEELRRHVGVELTLVRHGDPHAIRAVVLDAVVPVKATRLEAADPGSPPFIFEPEQEGERVRQEITRELGVAPCPQFHPLTRLLAAAPRGRGEWVGILAEDCLKPSFRDGIHPTIVIRDGASDEPVLFEHQGQSWVWAAVNVAYGLRGVGPAEAALLRWSARDPQTKVSMLDRTVQAWRQHADSLPELNPEHRILSQIVLLIRLEHELAQRRCQEAKV